MGRNALRPKLAGQRHTLCRSKRPQSRNIFEILDAGVIADTSEKLFFNVPRLAVSVRDRYACTRRNAVAIRSDGTLRQALVAPLPGRPLSLFAAPRRISGQKANRAFSAIG
jgi:hypothetical protein